MQMLKLAITVLLQVSFMNTLTLPDRKYLNNVFGDYQAKFAKKYNNSDELAFRKGVYQVNIQAMEDFNKGNNEWAQGENMFTDLTAEERSQYLGLKTNANSSTNTNAADKFPSSTEEAITSTPTLSGQVSWNAFGTTTPKATTPAATTPAATANGIAAPFNTLAKSINWVTAGAVSPVKNQGQCGGCYAFAALGMVESLFMQKFKTAINLSEQELVDCSSTTGNSGCGGGLINNALTYIQKNGVRVESAYPYTAVKANCAGAATTKSVASAALAAITAKTTGLTVGAFKQVGNQSLVSLLTALQTAPVAIAMNVSNALYSYKSGIFSASSCTNNTVNHAVLAVGYSLTGDAATGNKPYILIKNSWGTTWGEAGYFKLEMPLKDAGAGSCGITIGGYNFAVAL